MQLQDPASSIGTRVRDIYGRDVGLCVGYAVDLAGNVKMIGIEQGTIFSEYPADYIASIGEEGLVIMPEWKAESRRVGMAKGVLDKRVDALGRMLRAGEISRKVYDQMNGNLMEVRQTHEELSRALVKRLEELEANEDKISTFLAKVKMQGASGEIGQVAVKWTADFCAAMRGIDENERAEIAETLDLITDESTPAEQEPIEEVSQAESTEIESAIQEQVTEQEAPVEESDAVVSPSLRSLGSNGN